MTTPMLDKELHDIAQRHTLDAPWFNGGLHDPNSYVGMAHKDRGELLKYLIPRECKTVVEEKLCPRCDALVARALCGKGTKS